MAPLINLIVIFSLSVHFAFGQVGQAFPQIETETVSGKIVKLPSEFSGTYSLIGIGTSKKAEEDLRSWQTPVYNKFIAKTGLMDQMYDVKVGFLPLFTGATRMAKDKVVKKLKENNEKLVMDHVYVYSGNREPFLEIGIEDKTEPYFLLLDANGKILWYTSGKFRQKHLDAIEEVLNQQI